MRDRMGRDPSSDNPLEFLFPFGRKKERLFSQRKVEMSKEHNEFELVSIAKAAEAIGISRQALSKQVRDGVVRSWGGKVRIEHVIEDRARNLYRGRGTLRK